MDDTQMVPTGENSFIDPRFDLATYVLNYFEHKNPMPVTELNYENSYQLAVAVVLSAQCTDKRVNLITPNFFKAFPDTVSLSQATKEQVYALIKSISYPNNKAKNLIAMAKLLVDEFNAELPSSVEDLQKLPGVGRKTANVLASVLYNTPAMAVDTHVFRVSNRIGLTDANNPTQSEKQLVSIIPENRLAKAHHWLILHGRYVCRARNPKCDQCGLTSVCEFYSDILNQDICHRNEESNENFHFFENKKFDKEDGVNFENDF